MSENILSSTFNLDDGICIKEDHQGHFEFRPCDVDREDGIGNQTHLDNRPMKVGQEL